MRGCTPRRRIEIRGLPYSVVAAGLGPASSGTILFLHGFAGGAEDWTWIAEWIRENGFASIAVDLPGHGYTDSPSDPERYAPGSVVRDLTEMLDALGVPAVHVFGYSMGARLALRMALDAPERVRSLILESGTTGLPDPDARRERREKDEQLARDIESRGIEWFVPHWEALPIFSTQRALPSEIRDAQRARRLLQRPEGLARALRGMGQGSEADLTPRLPEVAVPALILAGEQDATYRAHAERLASGIPDSKQVVIRDAGHNIHLEQPEALGMVVTLTLNELRRQGSAATPTHD
ncbi:MAG TPA: 2-succinyl-6-hydroxy-2,4-cyclohexadiene-1-carboxylate synthase [Candidatus Eisenbacteria bacterium]|nr:2-succinyl-6-hydroxy-2,4-cyclohexadiene-1-carboxylate synthase [Candidatus Eisenbacteria bacterium]